MKFPDFLTFDAFNKLRETMGAETLGQFDFFDPRTHLSSDERQQLQLGLRTQTTSIFTLSDFTLGYKNGRVLACMENPIAAEDWVYHPAACDIFKSIQGDILISMAQPRHAMGSYHVCPECLQLLRYKGFDAVRNRHRHYSQRLQEEFNLEEFFKSFPSYPVNAKLLNQTFVV